MHVLERHKASLPSVFEECARTARPSQKKLYLTQVGSQRSFRFSGCVGNKMEGFPCKYFKMSAHQIDSSGLGETWEWRSGGTGAWCCSLRIKQLLIVPGKSCWTESAEVIKQNDFPIGHEASLAQRKLLIGQRFKAVRTHRR